MNMRSPIVAMLWENWRLTRIEVALRLGQGIGLGSAAMLLFDAGAAIAFWIILCTNAFIWFSIAKLNGGRFMDGYKPGFPFYLLYSRPVSTSVFVGVTVGYDALSGVVLYLVSAALVGFAFDQPLPLFSVIPWILASRLGYTCIQWSTPNRIVQWVGSFVVYAPMFILLQQRVGSPPQVELSITENAVMILVGVVSFALTVVGVARQRRGDFVPVAPRSERSGGYPVWFVSLFRFPCPTTSPTRAQVWFELKSSGLPVLTIGLAMAVVTFLLYVISIVAAPVRPAAVAAPIMFGLPILLLYLGGNAFGIRRRQGRTYVSAFEATQPYNTAQLASVKLLVRTACVLAALIVVGVSLWASSSLMSVWTEWIPDGQQADAKPGLLKARQEVGDAFGGLTAYALAVLPVVMSVAVALVVASLAAFTALRARYSRRILIAGSLLLLFIFALVLLVWAVERGIAPEFLLHAIFRATAWIALAAMALTTIYLIWSGFADRALTVRYACGALVIVAAAGATRLAGMPETTVAGLLWLVLPILLVAFLAPWSLSRVRHG
jgi:hypothetical protein